MAVTIQKNVPIPSARSARYPWEQMEVGDSFVANTKTNPASSASINKTLAPRHFIGRALDGGQGFRVWRDR